VCRPQARLISKALSLADDVFVVAHGRQLLVMRLVGRRAAAAGARVALHQVAPVAAIHDGRRCGRWRDREGVRGGGEAVGRGFGDGSDGDAPVLAAALDALVGVLVQLREVKPHFLLLVGGAAEVAQSVEAVRPVLQCFGVELVLMGLNLLVWLYNEKARTLRFPSWENGFPQSSSLHVYGLA
jgi:hypothetical protein